MVTQKIEFKDFSREECIETTFKEMGIRAEKKIAEHILKENIYDDNLISDISETDYTANNNGKTHLKPIDGCGLFVDDLYIYGYLGVGDIVFDRNGGINCTTGNNGSASFVIEQVRAIVKYTIGKDNPLPIHINFMHTIEIGKAKGGRIFSTIEGIEEHINIKQKWKECNNGEKPIGAYVLKIDVSNIPLQTLQENLLLFQTKLLTIGNAIYCVDYTQDFSGTLHKKELIDYLLTYKNFRLEKSEDYGDYTILNNAESVGDNV